MEDYTKDTESFARDRIKEFIESDGRTAQEQKTIRAILRHASIDSMSGNKLKEFYNLCCRSQPKEATGKEE